MKEGVIPHAAVVLDVDDHPGSLPVQGEKDPVDQELEALECFVPPWPIRLAGSLVRDLQDGVAVPFLLLDVRDKAKMTQDGVEDFCRGLVHCSGGGVEYLLAVTP
jgi:hypothetical protein